MPGLTPFGIRVSAGQAPPLNPGTLANLLWWADVGAISPTPANGAFVTTVPTAPGTPTVRNGVNLKLTETAFGTFDAAADTVGAINMSNASYSQGGLASTIYAQTADGGLTFYHRFLITSLAPTFGGEPVLQMPVGASGFTLTLGNAGLLTLTGNNFAAITVGTLGLNSWHTVAMAVDREPGNIAVYLDGLHIATQAQTGIICETGLSGLGLRVGAGQPIAGFEWNSTICYQASHSAAIVGSISRWLALHR